MAFVKWPEEPYGSDWVTDSDSDAASDAGSEAGLLTDEQLLAETFNAIEQFFCTNNTVSDNKDNNMEEYFADLQTDILLALAEIFHDYNISIDEVISWVGVPTTPSRFSEYNTKSLIDRLEYFYANDEPLYKKVKAILKQFKIYLEQLINNLHRQHTDDYAWAQSLLYQDLADLFAINETRKHWLNVIAALHGRSDKHYLFTYSNNVVDRTPAKPRGTTQGTRSEWIFNKTH